MSERVPLSDRMKRYEDKTKIQFPNDSIVVARIDGRGFSKFTKKFTKPFDEDFTKQMVKVTKALVKQTCATVGYTQSDEISLIWHTDNPHGQIFFAGKHTKMCSVTASIATAEFNDAHVDFRSKFPGLAQFDSRVFTVPSKAEAINYLISRQRDGIRNSVQMAAHTAFGHKRITNKDVVTLRCMLDGGGFPWENYPVANRLGTFCQRETYETYIDSVHANEDTNKCTRSRIVDLGLTEALEFRDLYKTVFGEEYVED